MERTRIKLTVYVNLDPTPGTFHTPESAKESVLAILNQSISHYKPEVYMDPRDALRRGAIVDIPKLVLSTLSDAETILYNLQTLLARHNFVTLSELNMLIGSDVSHEQAKLGWKTLEDAEIVKLDDEYLLRLPTPQPLEL